MLQLVYVSRACNDFDQAALGELAKRSAACNKEADITGLLLFDGSRFMQALEGDERLVRELMVRIVEDRRHDRLIYLQDRPIQHRQFGHWSMRFRKIQPDQGADLITETKLDVKLVDDPSIRAAFIGFAVLGSRS